MTSHELARLLLTLPDLPVATHAHNHTHMSAQKPGGGLEIGHLVVSGGQDHIVIGNIARRDINRPSWYVTQMYHGSAPATIDHKGRITP